MQTQTESSTYPNQGSKWVYLSGIILLAISSILFVFIDRLEGWEEDFSVFFFHYFIAMTYTVVLLINKSLGILKSWRKENLVKTIVLLNLFLISAYALNREIPVFEDSVDWLSVYIVVSSINMLSYRFSSIPRWLQVIRQFILGSTFIFYLYLSLYVANVYPIGVIGTVLFGIGAHVFVPIFLLIAAIMLMKETCADSFSYMLVALGSISTITVVTLFVVEWNSRVNSIERISNQSVLGSESDLPVWVTIGQTIENDWITHRLLKSNLVYTVTNDFFRIDFLPNNTNWDEDRKHDPLVFIASLFGKCTLPDETRIKILESISDSRHQAQERLWSGDNLITSYVVSDIDIYPNLRLAYTEKYLNIKNQKMSGSWWGASEEAIYTFQLPEGSVVTSLSLWINGQEEKSFLTTKQRANEAYTTIVGVEIRDPSVVHWQEGNTITARIFPCTKEEERKFKIGFTSPLPIKEGRVVYQNIAFRGPNPEEAKEAVRIRFIGNPNALDIPSGFEKNVKGEYFREQNYDSELSVSFAVSPISNNQFSFDGFTYSIAQFQPELMSMKFTKIFLDLNKSWSQNEVAGLAFLIESHEVYVLYDNEFITLSASNWDDVTSSLLKQNFSLFPFHLIKDENTTLVISKGKELSPYLKDFKESPFAQKVSHFFASQKKVKLYNLRGGVSTYVSSFRELRGLEFAEGDIEQLQNLLRNNQFPITDESEERVVLHDAQFMIQKIKTGSELSLDNAPDHLARLFAYNNIMRKVGASYFNDDFIREDLVKEAEMAYVVSPVSSLIVLERQADYDRFGIKGAENSLQNASKQSSGAVPEPHEWAMIIVFALLVIFMARKKYQFKVQQ